MSQYKFLLSSRWVVAAMMVLIFSIACHFLAQWQLARRAEAQAEIARVQNNFDAAPVPVEDALPARDAFDMNQKWTHVSLTGRYLTDDELVVRNRPCRDASGYAVLTPFETESGAVLFVDRGCVPAGETVNTVAEFAPAPSGEVTIYAHLLPSEPIVPGRENTADSVGSINLPSLSDRTNLPAFAAAYGVLSSNDDTSAPYPAERPMPDEGPHLSYALQWYVFALIALAAYIWAARQEARRRREDALAESDSAAPATSSADRPRGLSERYGESGMTGRRTGTATVRPRRSNDADYEDALIDHTEGR